MKDQELQEKEKNFKILQETLAQGNFAKFLELFSSIHIYEQGQFYLNCPDDERFQLYQILSPEQLADIFNILEEDNVDSAKFISEMDLNYVSKMISKMYSDNAADLLNQLDDQELESKILNLIDFDKAHDIMALMDYQENTAGSIMTSEYVSVHKTQTIMEAMRDLKDKADSAATIYYLYVVDDSNRLQGVVSLRELIVNKDQVLINEVMNERVVSVNVHDEKEHVAQTFRDYDAIALPVVDDLSMLCGIITVDDIIDVIDDEAASDYSGLAAVNTDEVTENPLRSAYKRLPWLVALLLMGMGTAAINQYYEGMVKTNTALIMFLTTVMGTSGNAGTQSLAVAVRRITIKDDENKSKVKMFFSDLVAGIIIGLIVSLTIFLIVILWQKDLSLALTASVAMFVAVNVGNLAGSLIPVVINKIGFDPAVASGPFISTLSDLTSVLIYYNIAKLILVHSG